MACPSNVESDMVPQGSFQGTSHLSEERLEGFPEKRENLGSFAGRWGWVGLLDHTLIWM